MLYTKIIAGFACDDTLIGGDVGTEGKVTVKNIFIFSQIV